MGGAVPYEDVDGVVGAWYGKGPGLDRSGDVLKHANLMGSGPGGGAVLFVGDDPSAKSSTLPYDTNLALADAAAPVLVPADQQDLFDLGVEAFRLSRFCGSWVGVRIVTAVADGIAAVDTGIDRFPAVDPEVEVDGRPWRHEPVGRILGGDLEELWLDRRLRAAQAWVTARGLDRFVGAEGPARLGVVCAGKTYRDVLGALEACGVGPADLAGAGIRILKLAMTYPVAPARVLELAGAVDEILVVEEKRPFVEQQVRAIVHEAGLTTPVRGKRDSAGAALVPMAGELTADRLVPVLTRVVPDLAPPPAPALGRARLPLAEVPGRLPAFCSGCPHNRSTVVPVGSITGRRRRLPRHDPLRAPARRRDVRPAHPDGGRGDALGRAGAVRRRPAPVPEPGRRHVQPLGQPGRPGVRRRRRPHHVQAALQLARRHDRRPGRDRADGRPVADALAGGRGRLGHRGVHRRRRPVRAGRQLRPRRVRAAPRGRRGRAGGAPSPSGRVGADLRPALRGRGPPPAQAGRARRSAPARRDQPGRVRGLRRLLAGEQLPVGAARRDRVRRTPRDPPVVVQQGLLVPRG